MVFRVIQLDLPLRCASRDLKLTNAEPQSPGINQGADAQCPKCKDQPIHRQFPQCNAIVTRELRSLQEWIAPSANVFIVDPSMADDAIVQTSVIIPVYHKLVIGIGT